MRPTRASSPTRVPGSRSQPFQDLANVSISAQSPTPHASSDGSTARRGWRRALKWLLVSVVTVVLLVGALLGAFGIVVGRVPEYRVQVQDWLSDRTGLVVEFRALSARLRLFGPELVFEDAVVRTPDRAQILATAERGSVGFDIWSSLRNGQLSAGRFALRSPEISLIRTRSGRIQLLGQSALPERVGTNPIAIEQLPTGRFRVRDALVTFRDEVTGRGPWSMSGISFELTRDLGSIRLEGEASLPETLGRRLVFTASADGGLQAPEAVVSSFSISGHGLDLAGWADVFPDEWPAPEMGRGSLELTGSLKGAALRHLTAKVDFRGISTALPLWATPLPSAEPMPDNEALPTAGEALAFEAPAVSVQTPSQRTEPRAEMVSYERIAFVARANRPEDEWRVTLSDLDVSRSSLPWQSKQIEVRWTQEDDAVRGRIEADRILLDNVWPLLAYLPESEQLARVRALRARGTVENLKAQIEHTRADPALAYSLEASLIDIGFDPIERAAGLAGISGTLRADESQGELQVASRAVELHLPRMFRDVLSADTVDGKLVWTVDESAVEVRSDELRLEGDDGRAAGSLHLTLPRDGALPVLAVSARGENLKVSSTGKYVPGHKLKRKTLAWFDRAFVDGQIKTATFEMNGPIRLFPYRNDEGTFVATAQVENAALAYHDDWLPATGIDAEVTFQNEGMVVRASEAHVGGLSTRNTVAEIKDFKDKELSIVAVASGDVSDAFAFLRASPLASTTFGEQLARIEGQGALSADVRLFFPIGQMDERDVRVSAQVTSAFLKHADVFDPVRALRGTLSVHNTLVTRADLKGQWLSGPLDVSVRMQDASSSELIARGRAQAAQLRSLLDVPPQIAIGGGADWQLTTMLAGRVDETQPSERRFHLFADLEGFALDLPAPLGKDAGEARTLDIDLSLEAQDRAVVRGAFGDVRALLSLRRDDSGWELDRGGLRADGQPASVPSHRGLRIEGTLEHFVLDEWLALKGERNAASKPLSRYLQAANVRVGSFELFGYRWSDLRGILQATPTGWRVDVDGPDAIGQLFIPESFSGSVPLRAAMERLVLAEAPRSSESEEEADAPTDPRALPALDVHIMDLHMDGRSIGALDLTASRTASGLNFEQMRISADSARAEGRGEWLMSPQGPRSRLTATVTSSDVSATLTALDYTPFIEAQHGEIRAQLSWPGGFDDNILEQASGTISVRAESGQIVNLQPGAGRMLGLFSVAALPRRLALDFSDLTDKGLAFDSIHGDFDLRGGNAYTSNLLLRGPAAEIGIAGRTGFGSRDYDQTAVVTGNLGASLPVAGALAGGPAVGAALLLFSQVFKEPLKGMTRGYYRITGPWDNPTVERVDASAVKDASARVGDRQ